MAKFGYGWYDEYNERTAALYCLRDAGPAAAPAILILTRILRTGASVGVGAGQPESRSYQDAGHAATALFTIGPEAQSTILRLLVEGTPTVRGCLIRHLMWHCEPAPTKYLLTKFELECLRIACRDRDPRNQSEALYFVNQMSRDPSPELIDPLVALVIDIASDPRVRPQDEIFASLVSLGQPAKRVIPRLLEMVGDSDPTVRTSAARTLASIDYTEKSVAPRMREWLQSADPNCVSFAKRVLFVFGEIDDFE
jgi:hypothetical protein